MTSSSQSLNDDILYELDKLSKGTVKRRLTNELVELQKQGAYINVEYCSNNLINTSINTPINTSINSEIQKSYVTVTVVLKENNMVYQYDILADYPFKPPTRAKINYCDYRSNYLQIQSQKTIKELKKFIQFECLCCSSLLCYANWTPSIRIITLIQEAEKIRKYRRIIINRLLAKKIIDRHLISDINLYQWLF